MLEVKAKPFAISKMGWKTISNHFKPSWQLLCQLWHPVGKVCARAQDSMIYVRHPGLPRNVGGYAEEGQVANYFSQEYFSEAIWACKMSHTAGWIKGEVSRDIPKIHLGIDKGETERFSTLSHLFSRKHLEI